MNVDTVTEEPEVYHAPGSSDNRVRHWINTITLLIPIPI